MGKIRVLIVDDHTIVRDGICALLALAADVEVVGEAANGREAVDKVGQLAPDVVLMDIAMPIMDGLEATRRIHKKFPEAKVLALTQHDESEHVFSIVEAGAKGFVSKTAASSELASGIRAVHRGDSFLSPGAARVFVEDFQLGAATGGKQGSHRQLTNREREVLKLAAEGYTTQEIADILVLSPKSVQGHKTNLMTKLDIHNRTDLIKYAIRNGIITV
jgi:two-component system response regulator NreC